MKKYKRIVTSFLAFCLFIIGGRSTAFAASFSKSIIPVASTETNENTHFKYNLKNGTVEKITVSDTFTQGNYAPSSGGIAIGRPGDIIGNDDRYEMNPYDSRIVYLVVTFPDGSTSSGSGFMISNTAVATAAHVVCDTNHGYVVAESVTIYPGLNGPPTSSSKHYSSKSIVVPSKFSSSHNDDYDYAVVELSATANVGYLGFTGEHSIEQEIYVTGYPSEYDQKQYQGYGTVTNISTARLLYDADTTNGESGSAVHDVNGITHAIHTAGGGTFNSGIKINATIFNLFMSYR